MTSEAIIKLVRALQSAEREAVALGAIPPGERFGMWTRDVRKAVAKRKRAMTAILAIRLPPERGRS